MSFRCKDKDQSCRNDDSNRQDNIRNDMNVSGLYIDILLKVVITMNFVIRTVLLRMMLKISALLNQFVLIMFTMRAKMIMFMMIIFQGLYYEAVIYFYFAF